MTLFFIGFIVALLIFCAFLAFAHSYSSIEQEQKYEKEQCKKNELKESMESGDSAADFDASVNVLHDLAKK